MLPFGTSSQLELPQSGNPAWAGSSRPLDILFAMDPNKLLTHSACSPWETGRRIANGITLWDGVQIAPINRPWIVGIRRPLPQWKIWGSWRIFSHQRGEFFRFRNADP